MGIGYLLDKGHNLKSSVGSVGGGANAPRKMIVLLVTHDF